MKINRLTLIIIACMINNVVTAQQRLTKAEAEATKTELIKTWKEELKEKLRTTNTFNCVVQGDLKMKYSEKNLPTVGVFGFRCMEAGMLPHR